MKSNKAWIASLGSVITGVLVTYAGLPDEVAISIGATIAGVLTWLIPNAA